MGRFVVAKAGYIQNGPSGWTTGE